MRAGRPPRPTVVVAYQPHPGDAEVLRQLHAGLEEEGVPFRTERGAGRHALELSHAAALESSLDVGLGLDGAGTICLHHAKFDAHRPVLTGDAAEARWFGHNAARLVVGVALKIP